ncbi:MAG: hypothetical protein FWF75_06290 [Propionibacteriaceae bacterium]|nr:hypothetical protein [Propionibacteriaceae bacterium]
MDIIVDSCTLSRGRSLPTGTVFNSFELIFSHTPAHPNQVGITLKATASQTNDKPGLSPTKEANVTRLLVGSEPRRAFRTTRATSCFRSRGPAYARGSTPSLA